MKAQKTNSRIGDEWSLQALRFFCEREQWQKMALRATSNLKAQLSSSEHFLYSLLATLHMEILFFKILKCTIWNAVLTDLERTKYFEAGMNDTSAIGDY